MGAMASQITSLTIVYPTFYSGADYRKHQSSASLAFVRGIHRWPVNSPHKEPVTRKKFPFDDVIIKLRCILLWFATEFNTILIIKVGVFQLTKYQWEDSKECGQMNHRNNHELLHDYEIILCTV